MGYEIVFFTGHMFHNSNTTINALQKEDILELYAKEGDELPKNLYGDFSFVLYNKTIDRYFAARDIIGIKALYFLFDGNKFHFSDDISELIKISNIKKTPNLTSLKSLLYHRAISYSDTMFEGIHRIPPAHYMIIEKETIYNKRYWYPENIKTNFHIKTDEAAKEIYRLLRQSIFRSISNLEETAFDLSGGVDSSSIVSIISKDIDPTKINCYSTVFNKLQCDETEYIESVLEKYPVKHRKIDASSLDYKDKYSLDELYKLSPDWPIILGFATDIPKFELMKKEGKKVLITGNGGDHLFSGSTLVYYELLKRGRYRYLFNEILNSTKKWSILFKYILYPIAKNSINTDFLKYYLAKKNNIDIIRKPMAPKSMINIQNQIFQSRLNSLISPMNSTILDSNIYHCVEKHFGIELRHPFFDKELIEFVLSLPPEMLYKNETIKWILREGMKGILPEKVRHRKDKADFGETILQQMKYIDIDKLFSNPKIVELGVLDKNFLETYLDQVKSNQNYLLSYYWRLVNIEYWLKLI